MAKQINSMEYWNERFDSNWEKLNGEEQTLFFAHIACKLMPEWVKDLIEFNKMTICDFGCALGQTVDFMHYQFHTAVSGVDFSEKAIEKARTRYPQYNFSKLDITEKSIPSFKVNVGYISNVLEHLQNPWDAAENVAQYVDDMLVVLIPFRESMHVDEHCNIFDTGDIPIKVNLLKLIYVNFMDCSKIESTPYADNQILLIYARDNLVNRKSVISDFVDAFENNSGLKINELQNENRVLLRTREDIQHEMNKNKTRLAEIEAAFQDKSESVAKLELELTQTNQMLENVRQELKKADQEQQLLRKELENTIHKNTEYSEYCEKQITYMKDMIYKMQLERNGVYSSFSWKITKPIRFIGRLFRNICLFFQDRPAFLRNIRNAGAYSRIKRFVPVSWKRRIIQKYFKTCNVNVLAESALQDNQFFYAAKAFEAALNEAEQLLLVFSGVKYVDSEGQRNIRLIHEARKKGIKVIFSYWRWDSSEEIEPAEDGMIKVPIDILVKNKVHFFETFFRNIKNKCILIEFPHPWAAQIVEIGSSFGWKTVYDVIDDWEEFSHCGQADWYCKKAEVRISNIVDLNIATAYALKDKISKQLVLDKPYYVISNGVDPDKIVASPQLPEYNFSKGNLQIGYFGHLTDSWFDWNLIKALAARHCDWTFHIIGYGAPENLKVPANIILYGKKEPQELPRYAAYWEVAIIPFINCELTKGVNPIKVFEYLQLGLPVVAADMPEIENYPYVITTKCENDFEKAILESMYLKIDKETIRDFITRNTWEQKCSELISAINKI